MEAVKQLLLVHALRPLVFASGLGALALFFLPSMATLSGQDVPTMTKAVIVAACALLGAAAGIVEDMIRAGSSK